MPPVPDKLAPIICPLTNRRKPGDKAEPFLKNSQKYFVEVISVADTLCDLANDELPDETFEPFAEQYSLEQSDRLEQEIELDEEQFREKLAHKKKLSPEMARLARRTEDAARERFEESARTMEDFLNVIAIWDRMDRNSDRQERYRVIFRGDLPLDYKARSDAAVIPRHYMNPAVQQLTRGSYLDVLFDCPYDLHELTADKTISKSLYGLKEPHKELFYFLAIRHYSTKRLAKMENVSDRNIRKVRATVMKKLRRPLYEHLKKSKILTAREREFLKRYEEAEHEKSV